MPRRPTTWMLPLAAVTTIGCAGSRPALLPPGDPPAFVDEKVEHPRIRFGDGSVSENDICPVTRRKLSLLWPPVYVNGRSIGFC